MLVRKASFSDFLYCHGLIVGPLGFTGSYNPGLFQPTVSWLNYCKDKQMRFNHLRELKSQSMGLKVFVRCSVFYIDVGYSHYCLFRVPVSLNVVCRRKRVYFNYLNVVHRQFLHLLERIKKFSVYKSKGLVAASRLKYMKLRTGKKQTI